VTRKERALGLAVAAACLGSIGLGLHFLWCGFVWLRFYLTGDPDDSFRGECLGLCIVCMLLASPCLGLGWYAWPRKCDHEADATRTAGEVCG